MLSVAWTWDIVTHNPEESTMPPAHAWAAHPGAALEPAVG